jgi:hypothetical protein
MRNKTIEYGEGDKRTMKKGTRLARRNKLNLNAKQNSRIWEQTYRNCGTKHDYKNKQC